MQTHKKDTAKGVAAVIAATGFVIAVIISGPVQARHGGYDNGATGRPASVSENAVAAKEARKSWPEAREVAALNTVMTDAVDGDKAASVRRNFQDQFPRPSR